MYVSPRINEAVAQLLEDAETKNQKVRKNKNKEEKEMPSFGEIMASQPKNDAVEHPSHYTSGGIECIDAIKASMSEEAFKGFLKGNVIKYIWRYEKKVAPLEDLKKAEWYLKKLEGELENGN